MCILEAIIWSDERKMDLRVAACVCRKTGEAYNPKHTIPHGGGTAGSIMLWRYFSASGTGNLVKVEGIMTTPNSQQQNWVWIVVYLPAWQRP